MSKPTFVKRVEVLDWFGGCDGFVKRHQELTEEKGWHDVLFDEDD